jgi:hypothetical protein
VRSDNRRHLRPKIHRTEWCERGKRNPSRSKSSNECSMITKSAFEMIKRKHGGYASWAVWGPIGATPKSGMGDIAMGRCGPGPTHADDAGGVCKERPDQIGAAEFHRPGRTRTAPATGCVCVYKTRRHTLYFDSQQLQYGLPTRPTHRRDAPHPAAHVRDTVDRERRGPAHGSGVGWLVAAQNAGAVWARLSGTQGRSGGGAREKIPLHYSLRRGKGETQSAGNCLNQQIRRGGRVAEGGGLLNRCRGSTI